MSGPRGDAEDPDAVPPRKPDHTELVAGMWFDLERGEIDLPHIVLSRNGSTGEVSYSGPYGSAMEALQAADLQHAHEVDSGGEGAITFHVAALYPSMDGSLPDVGP